MAAPLPLLAWAAARRLTGSVLAGVTAAVVPFAVPELSHVSSTVTSDALLILLGGLAAAGIAFVLRGDRTLGTAIRLGVISGLAALTGLAGTRPGALGPRRLCDRLVPGEPGPAGGTALRPAAASSSPPDGGSATPREPLQFIGNGIAAGARGVSEAAHWLFAQPEPRQSEDATGEHDDDEGMPTSERLRAGGRGRLGGGLRRRHVSRRARSRSLAGRRTRSGDWGGEPYGEEPHPARQLSRRRRSNAVHRSGRPPPGRATPIRASKTTNSITGDDEDQDSSTPAETEPFDESHASIAGDLPGEQEPVGQLPEDQPGAEQAADVPPTRRGTASRPPVRSRLRLRGAAGEGEPVSGPDATSRRRPRPHGASAPLVDAGPGRAGAGHRLRWLLVDSAGHQQRFAQAGDSHRPGQPSPGVRGSSCAASPPSSASGGGRRSAGPR